MRSYRFWIILLLVVARSGVKFAGPARPDLSYSDVHSWWARTSRDGPGRDLSTPRQYPTSSFTPGGHRRVVTGPGRDLSTPRQNYTPFHRSWWAWTSRDGPGRDLSTPRQNPTSSFTPGGHRRVVTAPGRDLSTPRQNYTPFHRSWWAWTSRDGPG